MLGKIGYTPLMNTHRNGSHEKDGLHPDTSGRLSRARDLQKEDRTKETDGTCEGRYQNKPEGNEILTFPFTRWRTKVKPSGKLYNRKKKKENYGDF